MDKIVKYMTYLAGPIEGDTASGMSGWRDKIKELLNSDDLLLYDPIEQEAGKTNMEAPKHIEYTRGLKKGGKWDGFIREMDFIWLGKVRHNNDLLELIKYFKYVGLVEGNTASSMKTFGDYEAVARSNFIICKWKSNVQTVGTTGEVFLAHLLNIPIYLILDTPKTEANSTLIYWTLGTQGGIFYNIEDCVNSIKEKYKL